MSKTKNPLDQIYYTYIYYDPSRNNEPIYVGKGKDHRAWDHLKTKSKKNTPILNRIRFMKRNNIVPIIGLYSGIDEELSHLLEEELIAKFGRKDLGKGPLLNLTNGGEGGSGSIRSEETRRKIGVANIGKDRTHSQETKNKISTTKTGVTDSPETYKRKSISNRKKTAKINEISAIEIFLSHDSLESLSIRYGISKNQISLIKMGKAWKWVTENLSFCGNNASTK